MILYKRIVDIFNFSEINKYQDDNRRYIGYKGIINGKIDELLKSEKEIYQEYPYMGQESYGQAAICARDMKDPTPESTSHTEW